MLLTAGFTGDRVYDDYGYDLLIRTFDDTGYLEPGTIFVQMKASDARFRTPKRGYLPTTKPEPS